MTLNQKISILVPVYNTSEFLPKCLDSIINQSYKNLEIICVNDGSKDNSLEILKQYQKKDSRIKIISLDSNEGLMRTRFHAIKNATGDYVMFLDSDDYLQVNACEIALKNIVKYNVDILHFSTNIIPYGLVDRVQLKEKGPYVNAYCHKLKGENIFRFCFIKQKFGWNLWNKIYRLDVVKKILPYFPNNYSILSEDMFIFSMITHFANTYYGIKNKLINYRFGSGVSTVSFSSKQFYSYALSHVAIKNMLDFHIKNHIYDGDRKKFIDNQIKEFKDVLMWHFMYSVSIEDAHKCFDIVTKYLSIEDIINRLLIFNDLYNSAIRLKGSSFFKTDKKELKNIAIFYYKYSGSGVERVISKLIPMFQKMNYKVTLILEKDDQNSFPLPKNCEKVIISSSINVSNEEYLQHAKELKEVLKNHQIDLLLYQASNSPFMLYDLLITKSLGVYFCATTHDFITSPLLYNGDHFAWKPKVLALVDLVQTITEVEKEAYLNSGVNATYIPNPLTFDINKEAMHENDKKDIDLLWVGRIDALQKNPIDIIHILKEIKKYLPNVNLTIIGSPNNQKDGKEFKKYISFLHLEKNINWILHTNQIEDYYKRAKMLVMTSTYEVYPMVLIEAMNYSLPIITYNMPYVEPLKNNQGAIIIDQNNIQQAAQVIMNLLVDEEKCKKLGEESYKKLVEISKINLPNIWQNEFNMLLSNQGHISNNKNINIFLDMIYEHYYTKKNLIYSRSNVALIINLFRYFKKFGVIMTIKKINNYVKKYGFKAAINRGRERI